MKKLLLAVVVAAVPAFGSHFMMCDTQVKVLEVKGLTRLDGTVIFKNSGVPFGPAADHEQLMKIKVEATSNVEGHTGRCISVGAEDLLMVRKELIEKYKAGDTLKLKYKNVGDRTGSSISWDIIK